MIRIDGVTKTFGSKTILDKVTYHFPERERIALVGANGAGKTTLLDILTGVSECDSGSILKPARLRSGYLPQEPNQNPQATVIEEALSGGEGYIQDLVRRHRTALHNMTINYNDATHKAWEIVDDEYSRERGYALESEANSILTGLGFTAETLQRDPRNLSGGWRMRLELAKIFLNRPNFLILDEPTNHLDLPSLIWVERWLEGFSGTLLFVSHDRSLLRRLPTLTLHLQRGRLTPYQGNFDRFLEERERKLEQDAAQADNLRKKREHLESFVERFGAKASKASQAQSKLKMISRLRNLEADVDSDEPLDSMHLDIPLGAPSGREVIKIKDGAIGYKDPLSKNIQLLVEKGQKIAVIGANGIGKSTLLKTIVGNLAPLHGIFTLGHNVRLAWYAQDQLESMSATKTILENVLDASPRATQGVARNLLGSLLFKGDDVQKKLAVLSGGEKARVGLARLLLMEANLLLLDEPTNHLDISSCEVLSQAIQDYEGTVVFVSHDREFIDSVCTHVYAMLPDGRGRIFEGKLEDYQRLAAVSDFPDVMAPAQATVVDNKLDNKIISKFDKGNEPASSLVHQELSPSEISELKKSVQKNLKLIEKFDLEMQSLHLKIENLNHNIELNHQDFVKVTDLAKNKTEIESQLQQTEEKWITTSEELDKAQNLLKSLGRSV